MKTIKMGSFILDFFSWIASLFTVGSKKIEEPLEKPPTELINCGYRYIQPVLINRGTERKWKCEQWWKKRCNVTVIEDLYDEGRDDSSCLEMKGLHNHPHDEKYTVPVEIFPY